MSKKTPVIQYVEGDLFGPLQKIKKKNHVVYLPHVCNCKGGWGSGFVVPLGRTYPSTQEAYKRWNVNEQMLGCVQTVVVREADPTIFVCNMVAQTLGGPRPLYYNHLATCMEELVKHIALSGYLDPEPKATCEIRCPMFGAGLAGGDWNFIELLIEDAWIKRGIPVTVYYLPDTIPENWVNKHRLTPGP